MAETLLIAGADELDEWRSAVRLLIGAGIAPERIVWTGGDDANCGDLLAVPTDPAVLPQQPGAAETLRVPKRFIDLAGKALLHTDPGRHALLYRLVWRLQRQPGLLADAADPDVRRLDDLAKAVRRDIHKMRAFVRFRSVENGDDAPSYVAWFEPQYRILRSNAAFFVGRFAAMRWSILTPQGSLHWDGERLLEGPPAQRDDAPAGDPAEELWRTYYASIFNPARLKVKAMLKEMPRRYWKNMPEATLIPGLVAGAQAREAQMVTAGRDAFAAMPEPGDLRALAAGIASCRECPIGCNGTRAVPGEGPRHAALMVVGEQPGDNEEMAGRPFVGPAGQLLDQALHEAGIDRQRTYLTNAVKHFKHTPTAKRRLHQNPSANEIDTCRWWLERERALVRPRLVVTLGASALRGLTGRTQSITKVRGEPIALSDGSELWPTVHPSYLLRLDGAAQQRETERFIADLAAARRRLETVYAS